LQAELPITLPAETVIYNARCDEKQRSRDGFVALFGVFEIAAGGRYWDRTSDFHRVKVALYR
jgi:hypothetical protein